MNKLQRFLIAVLLMVNLLSNTENETLKFILLSISGPSSLLLIFADDWLDKELFGKKRR